MNIIIKTKNIIKLNSPNVFVIVIVFLFLVVFLLVGSCFLITLFKYLNDRSLKAFSKCICHCLCLCLSSCPFVGQVRFSQHSDQMPQRSKVSKIALWRCSLNVFIIVFCLSSCPFVGQIKFSQHSISNASLGISLHLPSNIHSINHRAQQLGMNCELSSS